MWAQAYNMQFHVLVQLKVLESVIYSAHEKAALAWSLASKISVSWLNMSVLSCLDKAQNGWWCQP